MKMLLPGWYDPWQAFWIVDLEGGARVFLIKSCMHESA